jgi:heme oxygenase
MILTRLRESTRAAHENLESQIDLLGREWSAYYYQQLLQKFYGFYAVVEPPLWAHPHWQEQNISIQNRSKLGLLHTDLKYLGLSDNQVAALPRCGCISPPHSFPQVLGSAYVLEGATLGGQIITRHLNQELGIQPECGGAFFHSYGANVGPMWREFVEVLNTYPANEEEQVALVTSACDTFSSLEVWLSDIG